MCDFNYNNWIFLNIHSYYTAILNLTCYITCNVLTFSYIKEKVPSKAKRKYFKVLDFLLTRNSQISASNLHIADDRCLCWVKMCSPVTKKPLKQKYEKVWQNYIILFFYRLSVCECRLSDDIQLLLKYWYKPKPAT